MGFTDRFKGLGDMAAQAQAMGTPSQQDIDMVNRVTRLNQVGVQHAATIDGMEATGRTDIGGGHEYSFDVEVRPEAGPSYPASFTQFMHVQSMGTWAYQGALVSVRVDPQDPSSMMLWGGA
jgi:hypothetical protein